VTSVFLAARTMNDLSNLGTPPAEQRTGWRWRDNLISLVVPGGDDVTADAAALRALSAVAQDLLSFHEIVYVTSSDVRTITDAIRDAFTEIPNIRVIVLFTPADYEDLLEQGLTAAIGDYVVSMTPDAIDREALIALLGACVGGGDIARGVRAGAERTGPAARLIDAALRAVAGRRIELAQSRAFCVSRGALSKLAEQGWALRFFRLIDMSDRFAETRVPLGGAAAPRRGGVTLRRVRLVAQLAALRTPQLLTSLAIALAGLSVACLAVGVYGFAVWLFVADVAPGWTSIVLLGALGGFSVFASLAMLCLGVTQLLRQSQQLSGTGMSQEFSNADLFSGLRRLNVEVGGS
jgi:nitrate reductase NapE component